MSMVVCNTYQARVHQHIYMTVLSPKNTFWRRQNGFVGAKMCLTAPKRVIRRQNSVIYASGQGLMNQQTPKSLYFWNFYPV